MLEPIPANIGQKTPSWTSHQFITRLTLTLLDTLQQPPNGQFKHQITEPRIHVFGWWKEAGVPGGNPYKHANSKLKGQGPVSKLGAVTHSHPGREHSTVFLGKGHFLRLQDVNPSSFKFTYKMPQCIWRLQANETNKAVSSVNIDIIHISFQTQTSFTQVCPEILSMAVTIRGNHGETCLTCAWMWTELPLCSWRQGMAWPQLLVFPIGVLEGNSHKPFSSPQNWMI